MVGIYAEEILPLRASHSQAQPKALGLPLGTIYYHICHSSSIKQELYPLWASASTYSASYFCRKN